MPPDQNHAIFTGLLSNQWHGLIDAALPLGSLVVVLWVTALKRIGGGDEGLLVQKQTYDLRG
jgi:hypothetical protein